ncbi:MAG: enoyl-CoA hydratase [Myxococcales bacterium]|nr:enoyl-CoA hydratase [Myxococcales bacterium]MCB9525899.1 enoyl-CoA hydratase [Myxococcales bacterium]
MPEQIRQQRQDRILTLTFDRPERKNALTLVMYDALADALNAAAEDGEVRVVVLTGAGAAFTAGNDLKDFMQRPPTDTDTPVFRFLKALATFPKPLLAAVNGAAIGVGTTLLLHCDLAYAAEGAVFQMPFTQLALVPEAGSSYLLPRALGHRKAAELLLLGEKFGADVAERAGLINGAVPAESLMDAVMAKARTLAGLAPQSVQASKRLMKAPFADTLAQVMLTEGRVFIDRLQSPELAEAIGAFFQKRAPDFSKF